MTKKVTIEIGPEPLPKHPHMQTTCELGEPCKWYVRYSDGSEEALCNRCANKVLGKYT